MTSIANKQIFANDHRLVIESFHKKIFKIPEKQFMSIFGFGQVDKFLFDLITIRFSGHETLRR